MGEGGIRETGCGQKHLSSKQDMLEGLEQGMGDQEIGKELVRCCPSGMPRTWMLNGNLKMEDEGQSDFGSVSWRRTERESWPWAEVFLCFWGFLGEWSLVPTSVPSDPQRGRAFGLSRLNPHPAMLCFRNYHHCWRRECGPHSHRESD